ncbi:MAG: ABC transporter ATP-binding protein [Lachnospiraceae bacterium]|nr:ABC transporter ATP-binding protein [Lachnospiraceae bacterium]
MIQVENLVKRYGVHTAVDDLSFTVDKGQIYGFLGPNGAGKSTTMNIMTGYIAASSGTVKVNGYDIMKEPENAKKCIGYLPEIPPLYTDMTVWEYLMFAAELKKVPKGDRIDHVEEIVEKLQLEDVEDRLIRNISKGYKQRVGLAQALIGYPAVLILDEPMVGLDPKQIIEMRDLIKSLGNEHTIILSSHILSEVSAVCDHIMIISKGKLVASGSPEELQEMMQAKAELEIMVLGTKEQVEQILQGMAEVESYEIEEAQESGAVCVRINATDNADIRKELSLALSGAGLPILSMNRLEKSLEDIFLELTESEGTEEEITEEDTKEDLEKDSEEEDDEEIEKEEPDDDSNL